MKLTGQQRGQQSRPLSVPAPVGGWNARDSLADMKPDEAVILDNFFCTPYDVTVRKGCSIQTSGITGTVQTLMSYSPPSGALKLFSIADTSLSVYNSTTPGAVGAAVVSGLTNAKFQKVNFGTGSGQNYLVAVNGADYPLVYDGTNWSNIFPAAFNTAISAGGLTSVGTLATCIMTANHNLKTGMSVTIAGANQAPYNGTFVITIDGVNPAKFTYTMLSAPGVSPATTGTALTATPTPNFAITGVDPSTFIYVNAFKARLFFLANNSLIAYYMPVNSIGGAASPLDFSSYLTRGGYLMAMATWSLDAGYGMDDYAAFISSEGQVLVYKGTDPSDATKWALVGVYQIGTPVGRRCVTQYGGDVLIICKEGLAPLSRTLMSSRVSTHEMLTDKIQHVISDYTTSYGTNFGWQPIIYPEENMVILNVPVSTTVSYQLVMNTISGAWSRFLAWNAACWERHGANIYYGTSTAVNKAWDTYADAGMNISFEAQQSFNYLGSHAQQKVVHMLRPILSTDGSPAVLLGVNVNFDSTAPTGVPSFTANSAGVWGTFVWGTDSWGGSPSIKQDWQTAFAIGWCFAAHMTGQIRGSQLHWASTDYIVEPGGMI